MSTPKFLSRGIDYLGDLGTKLRDLQGYATLARELIQNADDAQGVSSIVFDVRDEGLYVENDGTFTDCGRTEQPECPWKDSAKGHRCDFHRFRIVAGGDKREEADTTGAFGIGFIAVYQITDRPELISAGKHWKLKEERQEGERIEVCPGCGLCTGTRLPKTRFVLPWATDRQSFLRKALRAEVVSPEVQKDLLKELQNTIPTAMLFLRQVRRISVKVNGRLQRRFDRMDEGDSLILSNGDPQNDRVWHLFHGDFAQKAAELKEKHPLRIEAKRSSKITLAIPQSDQIEGLLCAFLPTQHQTGLLFHINADFFASSDRKHIVFEADYQSEWNRSALEAAAETFCQSIDNIRMCLGHIRFWQMLDSLKRVAEEAENGQREACFSEFWKKLEPKLRNSEIVYTTRNDWRTPGEAVLLLQKEEERIISVLEGLDLPVVHEHLRPFQNILRNNAVGTPVFDINILCKALFEKGLSQRTERNGWPSCLQAKGGLELLWKEVILLLSRQQNLKIRDADEHNLKQIALAEGIDGALWPCGQVYRAEKSTRALLEPLNLRIPFLKESEGFAGLSRLCPQFSAETAIEHMERIEPASLELSWKERHLNLKQLFLWFEDNKSELLENPSLRNALAKLRIFPSTTELRPLEELALPGDFEDPLGLAALVDLRIFDGKREFLHDLGMKELSFEHYVSSHLPRALDSSEISHDKRLQVVSLLADRLGSIKDDKDIRECLRKVRLVECTDGVFRQASVVYFTSEAVQECLADDTPLAQVPKENESAVRDLYGWLGVAEEPRLEDLETRLITLTSQPPSPKTREAVQRIFAHLGQRFQEGEDLSELEELKTLSWLPARGSIDRWFKPEDLHAAFQDYLFESQALFLDIPRQIQSASNELLDYLRIKTTPSPALVVKHLLTSSSSGKPVNQEVYRFLNDNVKDPAVRLLEGKPWILLPNSQQVKYIKSSQVFWGQHSFGRYRWQLGPDLHRYDALFKNLGVRDTPDEGDAFQVLLEISEEFGSENTQIEEEAYAVLMYCWELLQASLETDNLWQAKLSTLSTVKCVANRKKLLTPPNWMFFENRAGLSSKFPGFLDDNVIPRPLSAGKAMSAAGVRALSSAVEIDLIECVDPIEDFKLADRVKERRTELGRVLDSQSEDGQTESRLRYLDNIRFESVRALEICYSLNVFDRVLQSKPEFVPALFLRNQNVLFFVEKNDLPPWSSIARELAVALFPDEEPGRIASGLKEVLASETLADAATVLDELGFATIDITERRLVDQQEPVRDLGGEEITPDEAIDRMLGQDRPIPTQPPSELIDQESDAQTSSNGAGGDGNGSSRGSVSRGRSERVRRGRLRSYVREGDGEAEWETDADANESRSEIEQAGMAKVVSFETAAGRMPEIKPPKYPGYDIESRDSSGKIVRYIEVKSIRGRWGTDGVGMSKTQFAKARELRERYWLYVVECANQPDSRIHCIQDPAHRVDQFLFDDGWRGAAEPDEPASE